MLEQLYSSDARAVQAGFAAAVAENATLADNTTVSGWLKIIDSQIADWGAINNVQTPGWTNVSDTQTPGWTLINDEQ